MKNQTMQYGLLKKMLADGFYKILAHYETDYHGLLLSWGM